MEAPWVHRELGGWTSTELHASRLCPPPAMATFNLGGQVGRRCPQEADSNPLESGLGPGEQGFLRARLSCWVGSAGRSTQQSSSEQRPMQAESTERRLFRFQAWSKGSALSSRNGKEVAGQER